MIVSSILELYHILQQVIVSIQPDIHKLKSTGWKPKVSFKDGVEKIVKAMEK